MAYRDFRDLPRRAASVCDKAFHIDQNPKYDGYRRDLVSMVYKFFHKKWSGGGTESKNILSQELAEELHEPIIRKFEKKKVNSSFINNFGVLILPICY